MARKPVKKTSKKPPSVAKMATRPVRKSLIPRTLRFARLPARRPSQSKSGVKSTPSHPPIATGLSLDRKLDIIGIVLILLGLLTIIGLASTSSSLPGAWLVFFKRSFGWGTYLLPLGLIALGVWLMARNFERLPSLAVERLLGIGLLYLNLIIWLHFIALPTDPNVVLPAGQGGGFVGGALLHLLFIGLGVWGTVIVLMAWAVIAMALSLDVTVLELFKWAPVLVEEARQLSTGSRRQDRSPRPAVKPPSLQPFPTTPQASTQPERYPSATSASPTPTPLSGFTLSQRQPEARAWVLPAIADMFEPGQTVTYDEEADHNRMRTIEETLGSFGAPAHVVEINRGPTITQYGVEPDFIETRKGRMRVRVGRIASLADDLALALAAKRIRIQAPVPGKGYVGIEVPNEQPALVMLRSVVESQAFQRLQSPLRLALGQNVAGEALAANLTSLPHLLIAGATGSGKSVCVNSIIACLLLHNTPDQLRIVMVDPKRVELTGYNGIPHLLAPVVVELEKVVGALQWIMREMDRRYHAFADAGARNIMEYNLQREANGSKKEPYLVVIVDELADLMMLAPDETERSLTRLAQLARATGIHLILSTQRPSVDVVTGVIKANFPARIAFAVASSTDSRVILDQVGAERLLGSGDMLFQAPDAPAPVRLQGVYVSDSELQRLVRYWRDSSGQTPYTNVTPASSGTHLSLEARLPGVPLKQIPLWEERDTEEQGDVLLDEAIDLVRRQGRASVSMLQRRMRIGYTRAARLIEAMEAKGIVGSPAPGTGTREVLDYGPAAPPADEA